MSDTNRCKIESVIERYDLDAAESRYDTIDDHLYARWIGKENRTEQGYRTLQDWFNKRLLRRVYQEHGRTTRQVESDYEVLIGDNSLTKADLKDELESDGINSDIVTKDFVSWGTIRTHLKDCLSKEKPPQEATTNWERESVEIASEVVERKVRESLSSLSTKEKLKRGEEAGVDIRVQLSCPECPTRVSYFEALDRGYICPDHR